MTGGHVAGQAPHRLLEAPIRTAIIGFGSSGRVFHAPFVDANPYFSLEVVVTADTERREAAHVRHPGTRVLSTVDELFEQADRLDLVVIGSPPTTHVPLARRALEHGLAVVADKPFCVRAEEGADLLRDSERLGLPLTVFQNRRWDGDFLTVRALVDSGALGEVRRFESRFEYCKSSEPKAWKRQSLPEQGGGVLFDLGSHLLDQALQLFGPVEDIHGELAAYRSDSADDETFVSVLHRSGVRSRLWMSAVAAQPGPRFQVLGSEGTFTKWGLDGQEAELKAGMPPTDPHYGVEPDSVSRLIGVDGRPRHVRNERGQYDAFYALLADALLSGRPLPVRPEDSVEVTRLIERLHRYHPVRR